MQTVTTIGLAIAKSVFQVHGVDAAGQVVIRRQLKRRAVLAFFQKLAGRDGRQRGHGRLNGIASYSPKVFACRQRFASHQNLRKQARHMHIEALRQHALPLEALGFLERTGCRCR
jgi:hypothetical protein